MDGSIDDQTGSDTTNIYNHPGAGSVVIAGAGLVVLNNDNSYTGGTQLTGGTLELAAHGAAGSNTITFATGNQTLRIDDAALDTSTQLFGRQSGRPEPVVTTNKSFANTIDQITNGDAIDLPSLTFSR